LSITNIDTKKGRRWPSLFCCVFRICIAERSSTQPVTRPGTSSAVRLGVLSRITQWTEDAGMELDAEGGALRIERL
jgi:hypothetical protein